MISGLEHVHGKFKDYLGNSSVVLIDILREPNFEPGVMELGWR